MKPQLESFYQITLLKEDFMILMASKSVKKQEEEIDAQTEEILSNVKLLVFTHL